MSTTTGSASTQTKTKKEGVQIKGRDVIYLNAPEICFPENAPLKNTEKRELYAILDELFQDGGGGGDDEENWQPPEMPEAKDNEIILVVDIDESRVGLPSVIFALSNKGNSWTFGTGNETVDWGDGCVDNSRYDYSACFTHCYDNIGRYIIKITLTPELANTDDLFGSDCIGFLTSTYSSPEAIILSGGYDPNDFLRYTISPMVSPLRAVQVGKNVGISQVRLSGISWGLTYVKYKNSPPYEYSSNYLSYSGVTGLLKLDFDTLPIENPFGGSSFSGTALQKADFCKNIVKCDSYIFSSANYLKSVDLSNLEEVTGNGTLFMGNSGTRAGMPITKLYLPKLKRADGTFRIAQYCPSLRKVYAPNITSIESNDFEGCYSLQELTLAENCNYNGNTFSTCYSLFPKPKN